ncbi:hypothetical protein ACQKWADRAFT_75364 [Trichoderma austrokoningii]
MPRNDASGVQPLRVEGLAEKRKRQSLLLEDPDYCTPICSVPPLLRSNNFMANPGSRGPPAIPNRCFASRPILGPEAIDWVLELGS